MFKNTIRAMAFQTIQLVDLQGGWFVKPLHCANCTFLPFKLLE